MKYRRRPTVHEAQQVPRYSDEPARQAFDDWACLHDFTSWVWSRRDSDGIFIMTTEGEMVAPAGFWAVQDVNGNFYAVEPDAFAKTYEIVE